MAGDFPEPGGHLLADLAGQLADERPDGLVGVVRHEGQIEADELVVLVYELERLGPRAYFLGDAVDLVVEDVAEPLGKDQR